MSNQPSVAETGTRWLEWAQVDVFADAPYQGNMLAVFPDATGLSDAQMQAIARETNLSETTFVLPRDIATSRATASAFASSPQRKSCPSRATPRWEPPAGCA